MLNQVTIVGRICRSLDDNGILRISVPRTTGDKINKIKVKITGDMISTVKTYCKERDLIGIRGRLEEESGRIILVAEKVTFLSAKDE